jgi:MHS family proline/betaine transporter-like MFS transporter
MGKAKILLASIIGTALEFYDFMLYAVFATKIGHVFFPCDGTNDFMAGWVAFAIAFVARPFGATVFGHIGDKFGRKRALILTVSLMGIPTFFIGILPGYEVIGMAAPVILIICRLLQGLCTGGEYNGSAIFALEHVGRQYPGLTGGLVTGASIIGALGANWMGLLVTSPGMPDWSWRIAFIFGAVISLFGLYIRLYISETPTFEKLKKNQRTVRSPLKDALLGHKSSVFTTMMIGLFNGTLSYSLFKFVGIYLNQYFKVPDHTIFQYTNIGIGLYVFAAPAMGYLLDKVGGRRLLRRASLFVFFAAIPLYWLLQILEPWALVTSQLLLGLCVASIAGPQHAFVQTLFPAKDRYSGVAFSFCVGIGIGAGLCPLLMKMLVDQTGNYYMPAFFLMTIAGLSYITLKWLKGKIYLAKEDKKDEGAA